MASTPFAKWRENGEPDPHQDRFTQSLEVITFGEMPHNVIAVGLISGSSHHTFIMWLTAGKERLRWLSRKLYSLVDDHTKINQERATLSRGELTDDELANEFFLTEKQEDLEAGYERIVWLDKQIKELTTK